MWHRAIIMVLFVGLAACGDTDSTDPDPGYTPPDITGSWQTPCFPTKPGEFVRLDGEFAADSWSVTVNVANDDQCAMPGLVLRTDGGAYTFTGESEGVAGAHEATFPFTKKTITAFAPPLVDALNGAMCGDAPWEAGVPQDVSDGCEAFGQHAISECPEDFDLIALVDGELSHGLRPADNDMCSKSKRPASLDPVPFARQ